MQGSCKEKKRPGQRSYSERASGCGCHNTIPPMVTVQEGEVALLGALLPGQWSYPHGHCYPNHKNRLFCPILMCIYVYIYVCVHSTSMGSYSSISPTKTTRPRPRHRWLLDLGLFHQRSKFLRRNALALQMRRALSGQKSNENDPKRRPKMIRKDPKWT